MARVRQLKVQYKHEVNDILKDEIDDIIPEAKDNIIKNHTNRA